MHDGSYACIECGLVNSLKITFYATVNIMQTMYWQINEGLHVGAGGDEVNEMS